MKVADIFGALGIDIDAQSFAEADRALEKVRDSAARAMAAVRSNAQHFDSVVLGTARSVGQGVADAAVSWDGWNNKVKKSIDWNKQWQSSVVGMFKAAAAGYVIWRSFMSVSKLADEYNSAASKIRQLTDDTAKQKYIEEELFKSAQDTASNYGDTVQLFQQVGKGALDLGKSFEFAIGVTDTLNKAIKSSGADPEGAKAALRQLAQGIGSGVLRGEEFNSVLEQAPVVIDLIAKSMGKTRSEMRKLANSGKLTSKVIFGALEAQAAAVDEAYAKRIPLVSDSMVRMRNNAIKLFGELFQEKEVAEGLGTAMARVADTVEIATAGIAKLIRFLAQNGDLTTGIVYALAAAFAAMAVKAAIAWAAVFGPIALVLAGLALLIAYWDDLVVYMAAGLMKAGEVLSAIFHQAVTDVKMLVRTVKRFFVGLADSIAEVFDDIVSWVADKVDWLIQRIKGVVAWLHRNTIGRAEGAVNAAGEFLFGPAPSATRMPGGAGAASITVGPPTFHITSNASDPSAVANEVTAQMDEFWDRKMRQADDDPDPQGYAP